VYEGIYINTLETVKVEKQTNISVTMGPEDDNQNSILKGILQNGSSFNYPAVRFGRVPKREKAKIMAAMQNSRIRTLESNVMKEMEDERVIIDTIVSAHFDTCEYTTEKIRPFIAKARGEENLTSCTGMTCPMKGGSGRPEQFFIDQFSDKFMDHVRQVCTFAKLIPGFKYLHHDDQVSLLKSCVFEVLLVRLSGLFDNQSLVCLNGDIIKRETISSMPAGNAKFLMDSVFELAQRINCFRLSDAAIGLFCAVVIIADRPGLRNPETVSRMQSKLKLVLEKVLKNPAHMQHPTIFKELENIVNDLRTMNTLHTEKFLQQARVMGDQVSGPNQGRGQGTHQQQSGLQQQQSALQQHLLYTVNAQHVSGGRNVDDWEMDTGDRDSTGSRSPQSSDSHCTTSMEEMSRRSPLGSVSSSESLGSAETFSKLSVNDLRIHGVNSVLLNALTSPASGCQPGTGRKREISRCVSDNNISSIGLSRPTETETIGSTGSETKCPFKTRKLDSPSDSGIDSPKAQGSQSTNTSVCSSPRSSLEEKVKEVEEETAKQPEKSESLEEQHPLLKRALQQPPQPFNTGGVTGFQDEVYKPHKKFRHSGRKDSDEPTSTQESANSPSPGPSSQVQTHSILASQLAAPPTYHQPQRDSPQQSVLASTLSRPVANKAREQEKRNEWLASLILEKGVPRSCSPSTGNNTQSLLMCAPHPAHIPQSSGSVSGSARHIPVPVAPTQPTAALLTSPRPQPCPSSAHTAVTSARGPSSEASRNPHLTLALSGLAAPAAQVLSAEAQPLNLSTRTPPPPSGSPNVPTEA